MVHCFKIHGDRLAWDSETQALLILDEPAFACLELYVQSAGRAPDDAELRRLNRERGIAFEELRSAREEIDELIAAGHLFAPRAPVAAEVLYPEPPVIKALCLHLCHDCNMRCRYCFAGTGDYGTGKRTMMSTEIGKRAIDFLIEMSGSRRNLDIDFFGGEPLLNWEVAKELTLYARQREVETGKELRLTLTTNALLLDAEKREFINRHMKNVVLSFDGRREVQDNMRRAVGGQSTFERVAANIDAFIPERGDAEYYVRGTYTHFNLDFVEDVLMMADRGWEQLSLEPVVGAPEKEWSLRTEDLPEIIASYERLAAEYVRRRRDGSEDPPFAFFHFNIDLESGPCYYKRLKGCGVGVEYCAVAPDGTLYPCHQFVGKPEFVLGNVMEEPPLTNQDLLERFRSLLVPDRVPCRDCWALYFCSGGCPAAAWYETGSLDKVYEQSCVLQQHRLECALWIQTQLNRD
ncbi:MAG: thioether cross-link-forming SCIFF peptide maturase [Clostridiaceae bacterium]|nr:thioether cross-link-forming SCIFF peptide maturase [Clostridiaceae bacterium]